MPRALLHPILFALLFVILSVTGLTWSLQAQPMNLIKEGPVIPSVGDDDDDSFTVLTANVGNSDPRCLPYVLKLCRKDVESRLAEGIQALRPDLVAIQEAMPASLCERFPIALPGSICRGPPDPPQIRRLLGPDYTIVCEARNGFECIAVRVDVGDIVGCDRGELCSTDRVDDQLEGTHVVESATGDISLLCSCPRPAPR